MCELIFTTKGQLGPPSHRRYCRIMFASSSRFARVEYAVDLLRSWEFLIKMVKN